MRRINKCIQLYHPAIGDSVIGSRRELEPAEEQKENAAPLAANKLDGQEVRTPPKGGGTGTVSEEGFRTKILQYLDAGGNRDGGTGMCESSTQVEAITAALEEQSKKSDAHSVAAALP
jgi:hypothetical protein